MSNAAGPLCTRADLRLLVRLAETRRFAVLCCGARFLSFDSQTVVLTLCSCPGAVVSPVGSAHSRALLCVRFCTPLSCAAHHLGQYPWCYAPTLAHPITCGVFQALRSSVRPRRWPAILLLGL